MSSAFIGFLLWLFSRPVFPFVFFGVTFGTMLLAILFAWLRYGPEAFQAGVDSGEVQAQDARLEEKLKRMKKGRGGF